MSNENPIVTVNNQAWEKADQLASIADLKAQLTAITSQLESVFAENAALKLKGREILSEAAMVYKNHNELIHEPWGAMVDCQTLHEFQEVIESETPATDAFLAEVRASGVDEFLRGSQLPYQIATVLADFDNVDDATLQTVIWSGQPPEPDGDVWHLEYVSRGDAIVRAVSKQLRQGGAV